MTRSSDIKTTDHVITGPKDLEDSITIDGATLNWSDIAITANSSLDDFFIPRWSNGVEFVDHLPPLNVINEMIEEYPTLKKTYENFRNTYTLVKQDWESKKND